MSRLNRDPTLAAFELRRRAVKSRAHPKFIASINKRIEGLISQFRKDLWAIDEQFPVMSSLVKGKTFKL